jgi:tRNA threonylcarbamoyladenosine biosynthesis protein TsaE
MAGGRTSAGPVPGTALDFISHSPEQTRRVGWRLGQHARAGDLFLLSGIFGAGKTSLTQGLAAGLGVAERATSPSFTLVNEHEGVAADGARVRLYHIDLYRLETEAEVDSLGLEDILADPDGICAIEWPDRLGDRVPPEHLLIVLEQVSETKRRLALTPSGARYAALLAEVRAEAFGVGV